MDPATTPEPPETDLTETDPTETDPGSADPAREPHPVFAALTLALEATAELTQVPVEEVEVVKVESVVWPDSCLGLPERGQGCARALHPGWRIRLGDGYVFHADQKGNVRRDRSFPRPAGEDPDVEEPVPVPHPDTEIRLRYSVEGGIAGGRTSFEADGETLSPEDLEELQALITESDFFSAPNPVPSTVVSDGFTRRLWIAVGRRNHEVVRGDGIEVEDPEALERLFAWADGRTPPMFPRSPMDLDENLR